MEANSIFALILDGLVVNCIVANENKLYLIQNDYDEIIRIDELDPKPWIGWTYDGDFHAPIEE